MRFVGPQHPGAPQPVDKAVLGMIGGRAQRAKEWFKPGPVGVCSRSGGMTSAISYYLSPGAGIGLSTIVHVGGDAIVGPPMPEIVELFENDPRPGGGDVRGDRDDPGRARSLTSSRRGEFTKPLVAYIGGQGGQVRDAVLPRRGHRRGDAADPTTAKVDRLREVGVPRRSTPSPTFPRSAKDVCRNGITEERVAKLREKSG